MCYFELQINYLLEINFEMKFDMKQDLIFFRPGVIVILSFVFESWNRISCKRAYFGRVTVETIYSSLSSDHFSRKHKSALKL